LRFRFPGGQRNLVMFALVAAGAFVITLYLSPSKPDALQDLTEEDLRIESPQISVPPSAGPPTTGAESQPSPGPPTSVEMRSYALPLVELQGLPPDVQAGTQLELWVSWEPPVTEKRRVQKLFGDVWVGRVIPPTVAEAPATIELLVPMKEFPELLFADRYGALSAAILASASQ
jgi:hypothetical protein